jgi:hypothetical protein
MRLVGQLAAGVVLSCLILFAHARMPSMPRVAQGQSFVPTPEAARVASLGFRALVADFYWLQAVQIVGATERDPTRHAATLGRLVDVVTTLDPWVDHPYRFAAVWMTDSEKSVREANRLLERGIAYHPNDWRDRFYLGFNTLYYLGDDDRAADAFAGASRLPGAPLYLSRLVARLRAQGGGLDVAETLLQELWRNTEDPYAKAEYEKALDEVETERRARVLDAARAEYQRRHGKDITAVSDLLQGPDPVLKKLPPELHGWEWVLDPNTGEIVSSYYQRRYRVGTWATDLDRKRWRERQERASQAAKERSS